MLALIKHPGSPAERIELPDDDGHSRRPRERSIQLKAIQEAVDGYVEIAALLRDAVILCDEEGKMKADRKQTNFHRPIDRASIVGTVIVVAEKPSIDGIIWIGLTNEQADRITKLLDRWALAGAAVGQAVEDWDPKDENEARAITKWRLRNR